MSEYMKLVQDTKEMTKRIVLKEDIVCWVLIGLMAVLAIIGLRLIWEECRDRKERKAARRQATGNSFGEYRPTVTDTVPALSASESAASLEPASFAVKVQLAGAVKTTV